MTDASPSTSISTDPSPSTDTNPSTDTPAGHHHGYISDKDRYLNRLRRIEGQARGIHKMVEEERYCIDILTQISAVTKSLEGVAVGLLEDHVRHCVIDAARSGDAEEKLTEATDAIRRLLRS